MFDTLGEVIAGGAAVMGVMGMLLVFFRRGGKVKAGGVTVGAGTLPCDNYQHEHMEMLNWMKDNLAQLTTLVRGINAMQVAETGALDVLLGLAEGDAINGQVKDARKKLAQAEGFKEATEGGM